MLELRVYALDNDGAKRAPERLRDHMPALFARHGFAPVGQWILTGSEGVPDASRGRLLPSAPSFVWMLRWTGHAARDAAFAGLYTDPGFAAARQATEPSGSWLAAMHVLFARETPAHPSSGDAPDCDEDVLAIDEVRPGGAPAHLRARRAASHALADLELTTGWAQHAFAALTRGPPLPLLDDVVARTIWRLTPLSHARSRRGLH
jgi:hypothetical protein